MFRDPEPLFLLNDAAGSTARLDARDRTSALTYGQRLQVLDELSDHLLRHAADLGRVPGLAFLAGFLRGANLTHLVERELPDPEALERFVPLDGRKSLRILPKGVVCHWTSGNVPLLGMFSWAVSTVLGNRNVVRLSTRTADIMTPLLRQLASLSPAGKVLAGETSVLQFDRGDTTIQETMSRLADVRVIWGGREAVEAIRALPSDWECETVVLGPRMSLAVIDPQAATDSAIGRLITDVIYFDQLACSSPQWVFVKGRPGERAFDTVVDWMAREFERQSHLFPRRVLGFDETYRIQLDRARVLLEGGALRRDPSTQWTMALVERPQPQVACSNRFVQVVPFTDSDEVVAQLPRNVQTVVTLLGERELGYFTEEAARRGVCRFPRPGEGNHFETPWDGVALATRLTRWVLRTEAATTMTDTGANSGWNRSRRHSNN
jgi:hypothetical protein